MKREVTYLVDAVVLTCLREKAGKGGCTCPSLRDYITWEERSSSLLSLNNEQVYSSLMRLEKEGEVERLVENARTVFWRPLTKSSILVAEPQRPRMRKN